MKQFDKTARRIYAARIITNLLKATPRRFCYFVAAKIAPESIAPAWGKSAIIDGLQDILFSRA